MTPPPVTSAVRVADATVVLGERPVLRQIDVSVRRGEVLAVLGANGSGKSTLVRTMLGLLPLFGGDVELFGTPLRRFREWHRVGYVPQRVSAASGVPASVWEVVLSGRLGHRRLFRPLTAADRAAARRALETVALGEQAGESVAVLSGGQQQRVLIGRALAGEPELLVLDEPTSGIDLPNQQALATALAGLAASGTTIVLVAHELGPLEPLVDRAVVLREGRVVHDGPPPPVRLADHHHDHLRAPPQPPSVDVGWLR